jgi:hypothetical protein
MTGWFKQSVRSEKCVPDRGGLQPEFGHNLIQIIIGMAAFITN